MLQLRVTTASAGRPTRRYAGVTLLEVLTAVGVISLLMAILVPAVQRMRESARRIQCTNNLRQLAQACEGVIHALQRYPDYTEYLPQGTISGHVELLAHLGEANVFQQIDMNEAGSVIAEPIQSSHNRQFEKHFIALFHCPSDAGPPGGNNYRACAGSTTFFTARPNPLMRTQKKSLC